LNGLNKMAANYGSHLVFSIWNGKNDNLKSGRSGFQMVTVHLRFNKLKVIHSTVVKQPFSIKKHLASSTPNPGGSTFCVLA
jgi:hypothetical protein